MSPSYFMELEHDNPSSSQVNARVIEKTSSDVTFTVNDIITALWNLNYQKHDGY